MTDAVSEPVEAESSNTVRRHEPLDWVDIVATIVMAFAALATAWSASERPVGGHHVVLAE